MKEYNPTIEGGIIDCPCHKTDDYYDEECGLTEQQCPTGRYPDFTIPTDCPARKGVVIKIKE